MDSDGEGGSEGGGTEEEGEGDMMAEGSEHWSEGEGGEAPDLVDNDDAGEFLAVWIGLRGTHIV
jgi:hypothetical protein